MRPVFCWQRGNWLARDLTILHREHSGKTDVRIIDFVDTSYPALLRTWDKRQRGYKAMGYRIVAENDAEQEFSSFF
jgi:hypothetical protein